MADVGLRARIRRSRTLRSLRNRNFRLFLAGHAVSVIGTWMQRVAQDWLVLELTDSAVAVGVATALQFLPMLLFGLWGGVLVDRVDRRRLIMWTQACSALLAAVLAVVVIVDAVELWMVFALALALGAVTVLDNPARHAFVAELVGPDDYVNGQALASTVHNTGRLVGPALAGALIAASGPGVAFAVNAASFAAVLWGLALLDAEALRRAHNAAAPVRGQMMEGLRYVYRHQELRACMILVAVIALFGQNFRVVLPVLARDTFHSGAEGYGWLTSALGLGAVLGALFAASRTRVTAWSLLAAAVSFGVLNLAGAASPTMWVALTAMVTVGFSNIMFNTLARTLLQLGTDPGMHGRVLALHGFVFLGSTPIGAPMLGWVCQAFGARTGLVVAGGTALLAAGWVVPALRRLRRVVPDEVRAERRAEDVLGDEP
ncbi:MAG TPA: MFS transporter [Nocardioidaceae bacterium]|nr:MFS transporter [Nocardioidaceae bacterium]